MNKEEAKHRSEVLKAYSEGKEIQCRIHNGNWINATSSYLNFIGDNDMEYRIKPEPKYRPYNGAEEFFKAQKEHGHYLQRINHSGYSIPQLVGNTGIRFNDVFEETPKYKDLLKLWKWQDGTPCGILEE